MDRKIKRFGIQAAATLIQNANFKGFFTGKIYEGPVKNVCVPGLNCYSCPGAVGSCPVGSLQNFVSGLKFRFPYYVLGLLIFFGALLGRAVCGFLCPFGFLQDLIYKIPFFKKNRFFLDRFMRYLKYAVLVLLVLILPFAFKLTPVFCKYLCPSGTLAGISLAAVDKGLRNALGPLFNAKLIILLIILVSALIVRRSFCKYLCPLGAFYGFFNRISVYSLRYDKDKCTGCKACERACAMCVDPSKDQGSPECIRCGECVGACPSGALCIGFKAASKSDNKVNIKA
ncbi:MAG: 4Fe-4S binding protein [Lachnospiraceae bacterium]|nr:4Fe-4S binding protein [Lachnospiraceae bacterium]